MKSEFSVRLGELRREKHLSQREAAAAFGISQALLSHYENGMREPKFEFVMAACDFYEVTADYLFGRAIERKSGAEILSQNLRTVISSLEELKKEEQKLIDDLVSVIEEK